MSKFFSKFFKSTKANVTVEFAVFAPVLLLILNISAELVNAVHQAENLEKSIFQGALMAAESSDPIPAADETAIKNFIKYGNPEGTGNYLLPGWADANSDLDITIEYFSLNGTQVPVVHVQATVPYAPTFPTLNLIPNFTGYTFTFSHEHLLAS